MVGNHRNIQVTLKMSTLILITLSEAIKESLRTLPTTFTSLLRN